MTLPHGTGQQRPVPPSRFAPPIPSHPHGHRDPPSLTPVFSQVVMAGRVPDHQSGRTAASGALEKPRQNENMSHYE